MARSLSILQANIPAAPLNDMNCWALFLIFVCGMIPCFAQAQAVSEPDFTEVSLVSLIATPEKFDGKFVLVQGVAYLDDHYGIYAVYLTRDDKRAANGKNGVFLILAPSLGKMGQTKIRFVYF